MRYWVEDESQYVGIIWIDNSKDRISIRIEKRKFNINFEKSSTESEEKTLKQWVRQMSIFNVVPCIEIVFADKTHSDEKRVKQLGNNIVIRLMEC